MNVTEDKSSNNLPQLPGNVGKRRSIRSQKGALRHFIIKDEIVRPQSNAPHKLIVFQKVYLEEEGRYEFRFGYYMIGVKGKSKGRWVWGQYCLFIPRQDLLKVFNEARKKEWF